MMHDCLLGIGLLAALKLVTQEAARQWRVLHIPAAQSGDTLQSCGWMLRCKLFSNHDHAAPFVSPIPCQGFCLRTLPAPVQSMECPKMLCNCWASPASQLRWSWTQTTLRGLSTADQTPTARIWKGEDVRLSAGLPWVAGCWHYSYDLGHAREASQESLVGASRAGGHFTRRASGGLATAGMSLRLQACLGRGLRWHRLAAASCCTSPGGEPGVHVTWTSHRCLDLS